MIERDAVSADVSAHGNHVHTFPSCFRRSAKFLEVLLKNETGFVCYLLKLRQLVRARTASREHWTACDRIRGSRVDRHTLLLATVLRLSLQVTEFDSKCGPIRFWI